MKTTQETSSASAAILLTFFSALFLFSSCKKTIGVQQDHTQLSDQDSLKYLMYQIMQVSYVDGGRDTKYDLPTYLWYNQVPKMDPLNNAYPTAKDLLGKIKTYPINPSNGMPYDKYSFLDDGAIRNETQAGVAGDVGLQVSYARDADNKILLCVLFVDKNSPAGKAGIQRSWVITAINGDSNIAYDGANGTNTNKVNKAIYFDPQVTLTFLKPDGTTTTNTLIKTTYTINPILFDTIYNNNGKNVGYFVLSTFANVYYQDKPTFSKSEIDRVFNKFTSAGVSSLIVDLRYNGGGSGPTAEYIDSCIAPSSVKNKLMYRILHNDKLTKFANQIGLTQEVFFNGGGNLNLSEVFFIGTRNTASASELVLNNLKPYMNVKLVGDTTYGKPVGFYIFNVYKLINGEPKSLADLYAINYETRNALNKGEYYSGIAPDIKANDLIGYNWGDLRDDNLKKIFTYLNTGMALKESSTKKLSKSDLGIPVPNTMQPLRFNGLIDDRQGAKIQHFQKLLLP